MDAIGTIPANQIALIVEADEVIRAVDDPDAGTCVADWAGPVFVEADKVANNAVGGATNHQTGSRVSADLVRLAESRQQVVIGHATEVDPLPKEAHSAVLRPARPIGNRVGPLWIHANAIPLNDMVVVAENHAPPNVAREDVAFALGSATPVAISDGFAQVSLPGRPWQLHDASGTSSAWFSGIAAQLAPALTEGISPRVSLWSSAPTSTKTTYDLGDGGVLENFGLLSLLRRKVRNIIVCANTGVPLNMDFSPTERVPTGTDLDAYLPPLFGFKLDSAGVFTGRTQVFRPDGFVKMVKALQAAKASGGPVVAVTELPVVDNDSWGIEGGWTVRIAWIYLDRSADFEAALGADVREELARGHDARVPPPMRGKLRAFPNVATANHNGPDLTQLTSEQARLLADHACWTVQAAESLLRPLYTR